MGRYAIIEGQIVTNVILADDASAPAGAVMCGPHVGVGWTYGDGEFSPPPAPPTRRTGISQADFRGLFTFAERSLEVAYARSAEAAAATGIATQTQIAYLTVRDDFSYSDGIDLDNPSVALALNIYVAAGVLTSERAAAVIAGDSPS